MKGIPLIRLVLPPVVAVTLVVSPLTERFSQALGLSPHAAVEHRAEQMLLSGTKAALRRLSIAFEPNVGQAAPGVDYVAHLNGYTALVSRQGLTLSLSGASPGTGVKTIAPPAQIAMDLVNSVARSGSASHELRTLVNYEVGSNRADWRTGVHTFGDVTYPGTWPGINVQYGGNRTAVEFEFLVKAHASVRHIEFTISGQTGLALQRGKLVISSSAGDVIESRPVAFQVHHGRQTAVRVAYQLVAPNIVRLTVGRHLASLPLVIDPSIGFGTYLGGSGTDFIGGAALFGQSGHPIVVGANGDVYVTGATTSTDFPGANGTSGQPPATSRCDFPSTQTEFQTYAGTLSAFVSEFNANGTQLLYSTYLGGSDSDFGTSVQVDPTGDAFVMGTTCSTDFPTTPGAFQNGLGGQYATFVAELNPTGGLLYSTYIGNGPGTDAGSRNLGTDMAIDSSGDAYVTGALIDLCGAPYGDSPCPFPTTPGAYDTNANGAGFGIGTGFLVKLNPTGTAVLAGTYLPYCSVSQIAIDDSGDVVLNQSCLPTTAGAFEGPDCPSSMNGTIAELDPTLSTELFGACLGGNAIVHVGGIAVDQGGRVYVTGETTATDMPTTPGAYQSTYVGTTTGATAGANFVSVLSSDGSTLLHSTYVGPAGAAGDYPSLAVDAEGAVYVTGTTYTTNLPTTPWSIVASRPDGCYGPYLFKLPPDLSALMYSTYFGGSGCTGGSSGIGLDPEGNAYVAGGAGTPDWQVTPGAFQTQLTGVGVGFVLQFVGLGVSGTVGPGGTLATSSTSSTTPYSTSVISPSGGAIGIVDGPPTTGTPGFSLLQYQVEIDAPSSTPTSPLAVTFAIDPSALGGQTAQTVQVRLDGTAIPDCTGGPGDASPNPCVSARSTLGDGSVSLTVLTTTT